MTNSNSSYESKDEREYEEGVAGTDLKRKNISGGSKEYDKDATSTEELKERSKDAVDKE